MKRTAIVEVLLFCFVAAFAQQIPAKQPEKNSSVLSREKVKAAVTSINFYRLTNREGLSQASANVIFKDSDGFLWIGTDDGLNRYDGKEVKRYYYSFNNNATIAANEVYGICEDKTGKIWAAHFNSGISILDKATEKFQRLSAKDNKANRLSSNGIYGIYCDAEGMIWARSVKGISSINPITLEVKNFDAPLLADALTANTDIAETADHIWFGGKLTGLVRITKTGQVSLLKTWNRTQHGKSVFGIYKDTGNQILVTSEKGLFRVFKTSNDYGVEEIIRDTVFFHRASKLFRFINSSLVWIATDVNGILIVDIAERKIVRNIKSQFIKDNLLSNTVFDLLQDEEKNVFAATGRGVNVYSPYSRMFNNYENLFRNIPDFGHPVYAIHELANGHLLLGTKHSGAFYFNTETQQVTPIQLSGLDGKPAVYHFTPFGSGQFLAATSQGIQLIKVKNSSGTAVPNPWKELNRLDTFSITDLVISNDSIIYISALTEGFFKWDYKKHTLKSYKKSDDLTAIGPVDNRILDLSFTHEKDIAICTKNGFAIFYPGTDSFMNLVPGKNYPHELPASNIKSAYDDGNFIWISTYGSGVQRYDKKRKIFKAYTSQNGLPNDAVYAVVPDNMGRLWISTNNGLASLNPTTETLQVYTTQDGLPDNEFNAYAAFRNSSGVIFYSTLNGIVSINPGLTAINPYDAKIVLTYLAANNGKLDTSLNTYRKTSFTLPAGYNSVILKFAALTFAAPDKNNYKVKLEGFDKDWLPLKNENEIRYQMLPPGNYTLFVQASNNSGKWSNQTLSVPLTVLPFWYQKWWFTFLIILVVMGLIYVFYHDRISQILKVEKMRRKISTDLHDDIGATLSSINIYSELAKNEKDNKHYLSAIQQYTLSTINNLDDLVWSINQKNDTVEMLVERMRSLAESFLKSKNIVCEFNNEYEKSTAEISLEQRSSLYFAFKEMINNIVKHSNATHCTIKIIQKRKSFCMEVKDNGRGFDIGKINHHRHGLINLKERAKEINGHLEIVTSPGQGATFTFKANFK
ncbi:MAG: hypothetical protein JWQ40_5143 [Segetibacter sp.]|nr:hypothetical protein [Segetibacter sp.]